ncbi:MAG: NUDIX domain-containing protein [Candidatus Staskawiczbacteria bacterium]|jgi:ADP-ribose pyrophosphatase YjhB (NUDIX family)
MPDYSNVVKALEVVDPAKPYGTELFNALARVTVSVSVEAVCLRLNPSTQEVEVYMTKRSPTDTTYPGEWHCPGSVMRPREEIGDVFNRLAREEFGTNISSTQFVANVNHPSGATGHFLAIVYLCALESADSLVGKWFPVNQLPEKTIETHRRRIIPAAVGAFVAENTKVCS